MPDAEIQRNGGKSRQRIAAKIRAEFPTTSEKRALRIADIMREDLRELVRKTAREVAQESDARACLPRLSCPS